MILANTIDLEQIVDSHVKLYASTRVARRQKWFGLTGCVMLFLVALLSYSASGFSTLTCVYLILSVGYIPFFLFTWPRYMRRRVRKYLREAYGDKDELEYEVEFDADGIRSKMGATKASFDWGDVSDFIQMEDRFELWIGKQALIVMRKSEFGSSEEYDRWREFAVERTRRK